MADESSVPPGIGPTTPGNGSLIRRRPEPLWIVALVICAPLIAVGVIFLWRFLTGM